MTQSLDLFEVQWFMSQVDCLYAFTYTYVAEWRKIYISFIVKCLSKESCKWICQKMSNDNEDNNNDNNIYF